jgi:hypothetical protein
MALGYTFSVSGDCYDNGNNGSIQIFASGGIPPYDFVWCCGLGTDTGVTSSVRTGLSGGTYTIVISDSSIIPETITAGVYVSSGVCVSTIDSTDTTCGGDDGTLTVSAATPYTPVNYYLYDGSNNFVVSGDSSTGSRTFFGLSAGTYNVDVFDSGGCSGNTGTCIIKSSTDINYGFYVVNNSNCASGNTGAIYVTGLTGNPPFTYAWSTGAITTSIGGLADGTYTLTITDATGCPKTLSATISTVPTLGIVNFVNVSPTCFQNDGSVTVNISGGTPPYYYQFSNGLNVISYLQSYTISGLFANSYSVNVTDAGLCTTNGITSISVPNSFNSVSISVVNSTCSSLNGSINVNVFSTNGLVYTYTLIDPLGNSTIVSTTNISHSFNGLSGGTYTVTVTNPGGCFYTQDVHLFTDNQFTVSSSTTGTTCGGSNGSVTLTASTSGIYTYELSGGYPPIINTSLTSVTFNNLVAGIYTATTTDNTGCVQYTTFVINSSSNVGFTLLSTFCGTGNEGTITALITSGNPPFTFNWSPNVGAQTGIYVTGLTAGTYSLTVTDDDGCQQTLTKDIVCGTNYASYELYNVCEGNFVETPSSKLGLLQMLNQGFNDLTALGVDCILIDAQFILNLNIGSTAYTNSFYYTTSLLDVPSDDLYVTTLTNLLNQVPNLGAIDINLNNNTIRINTDCEKILEGVEVKIDLKIIYDICCALQCGLSGGTAIVTVPTPCPNICSEWFWESSAPTGPNPTLSYYNCDGLLTVINNPNTKGFICVSGGTTPYYTDMSGGTVNNTFSACCYSQMFISGITSNLARLIIKPSIYPVYVNWGDGSAIDTFNVGVSTTKNHTYSSPFTGLITVYSSSLSTIDELSVLNTGTQFSIAIAITEIAKATSCKYFYAGYTVSVIGDVADLPNSLLTYGGYGDGITGDIANIPSSITSFEVLGDNTLYGDIASLSTNISSFSVTGQNTINGNTSSIPSSMINLFINGLNTIYGDIANLPTGLLTLQLEGNTIVSGNVLNLPPNIESVTINGANSVTGLIQHLPSTTTYVNIDGNNTLSGDLSYIPLGITFFIVKGNNTITTYSVSRIWSSNLNFRNLTIISPSSGFVDTEVNQLFADLAQNTWVSSGNGSLRIIGTSSPKYTNTTDYLKLINGTSPINNPVAVTIL